MPNLFNNLKWIIPDRFQLFTFTLHPKLWDESLHSVQHAYNRALHSSTGRSPLVTCFGYLPKSPMDFMVKKLRRMDIEMLKKKSSSFKESKRFMKQCMINWRKVRPSTKYAMTSIKQIIISRLVIKYGYTSAKKG